MLREQESKVDLDLRLGWNGNALARAGLETPGAHRLNRFFIQAEAREADHLNVLGGALRVHDETEDRSGVYSRAASLFRICRLGFGKHTRGRAGGLRQRQRCEAYCGQESHLSGYGGRLCVALLDYVSRGIQAIHRVIQDPPRDRGYEDGAAIGAVLKGLRGFAGEIIWIAG